MSRHRVAVVAVALVVAGCPSLRRAEPDGGADVDGGGDAGAEAAVDTGFVVMRQNPGAGAYRTIWVGGPELVYIGGDNGALIERIPNDWREVILGPGIDVGGVWGSGPSEALAVATQKNTNNGPIFKRQGGRWVQIGTAPHGLKTVWGTGNMRYAAGNDGVIYSGPPNDPLGTGFQAELNDKVAKTNFAPIMWQIGGNSETKVMVAADYDTTIFFDGTWHSFADPIDRTRSFRAMWGPPNTPDIDIYQGANYFGLWHFSGSTNPVNQLNEEKDDPANSNRWIWGIWGPSPDKIVCVGDAGRIMTFDKKTGLVKKQPSPTGKSLYAIGGTSLDDIWIVGEDQLVLHGHLTF